MTTTAAPRALPGYTPALYADVRDILAHGDVPPPAPTIGQRTDGVGLFYTEQVNTLVGDPEAGKTFVGLAASAEILLAGGSTLIIDIDYTGAAATVTRLRSFGVSVDVLSNPERFRYAAPDDRQELLQVVNDTRAWRPDFALIDSIGELLPMFGGNSNNGDDYTNVHAAVLKPIMAAGSCVVTIDHPAKNQQSRDYGATGTTAKKRAIGGTMLRVTATTPFAPGTGGVAELVLLKDRHGGLRARCGRDKQPLAAKFELIQHDNNTLDWKFRAPEAGERPTSSIKASHTIEDDIAAIEAWDETPRSKDHVARHFSWGNTRAHAALKAWREKNGVEPGGHLRPV